MHCLCHMFVNKYASASRKFCERYNVVMPGVEKEVMSHLKYLLSPATDLLSTA